MPFKGHLYTCLRDCRRALWSIVHGIYLAPSIYPLWTPPPSQTPSEGEVGEKSSQSSKDTVFVKEIHESFDKGRSWGILGWIWGGLKSYKHPVPTVKPFKGI